MPRRTPALAETLRAGGIAHGAWLNTDSADLARMASAVGYDLVMIDMQHGLARESDLMRLSDAIRAGGDAAVVARVRDNRFAELGMLADAEVDAIIVPLVSSAEDARRAVEAITYPDAGGRRSFGPVPSLILGTPVGSDAPRPLLFVMIENAEGLAAARDICAVDGVDGVFVGPSDLAYGVGSRPGPEEQVTADAVARVLEAAEDAGVIPGIYCNDGLEANRRREQGFRLVITTSDVAAARRAFREDLERGRGGTA